MEYISFVDEATGRSSYTINEEYLIRDMLAGWTHVLKAITLSVCSQEGVFKRTHFQKGELQKNGHRNKQ